MVTQPQMISARRKELVVSTINPVTIGANDAQIKLAKFWILPTEAVMREATATWIRPQHEVPAKWIQNSAIPISNTAAIDVVACGTTKVKAAEQNIPAIIQILRL